MKVFRVGKRSTERLAQEGWQGCSKERLKGKLSVLGERDACEQIWRSLEALGN